MDEGQVLVALDLARGLGGGVDGLAGQDDAGAEAAGPLDLGEGRELPA